jgi:hypothetical protein
MKSAKVRRCESAKVTARWIPGLLALLCGVLGLFPARASAQTMPGAPLALAHGVEREGAARYRDPP